jgi:predicted phage baseplate assembly protein
MALPELNLDDRTFQDLVGEARKKLMAACGLTGWTEHNVSDPGITLIELFAWMTELTIYRLNRLPEKIHLALLDLLGLGLDPPEAACADIRFRLKTEATEPLHIPACATEVATPRTPDADPVVFQVQNDFTIPALKPVAYVVERAGRLERVNVADDGAAQPAGLFQQPFTTARDRALYLGFDHDLSRLLVRIDVRCAAAHGTGINPDDPPLHWYVSQGNEVWHEVTEVIADGTGGFNCASGSVELALPPLSERSVIDGRLDLNLFWLACFLEGTTRAGVHATTYGAENRLYNDPPYISFITARAVGANLPATHTTLEQNERLADSDGTAGQTRRLRHAPALPLDPERDPPEVLEVRYPRQRDWQAWFPCDSFTNCQHNGKHFAFDPPTGEIQLPPAIRHNHDHEREHHEAQAEEALEPTDPAEDEPARARQRGRSESFPGLPDGFSQEIDEAGEAGGPPGNGRSNGWGGRSGDLHEGPHHHPKGYWERLGDVPPSGAEFRMKAYRHGGGHRGNVKANTLTVLRSSIPEVATVTNPLPASGGRDGGSLDLARQRAMHELRTRHRAVTVEDFEYLAMQASIRVGRAKCVVQTSETDGGGQDSGPITVYILAASDDPEGPLSVRGVSPTRELLEEVRRYLDQRRLLGCVVEVKPALLLEVTVDVAIEAFARSSLKRVEDDTQAALYRYLNPLFGSTVRAGQRGWGFGRSLEPGEIHGVIHSVYGVKSVLELTITARDPRRLEPAEEVQGKRPLRDAQLVVSGQHRVTVRPSRPQ